MMETMQQSAAGARSVASLVAQGLQYHQRGDLAGAERAYRAVLLREPRNADALHLMGSVRGRQGLTAEGIRLMEEAIAASPRVSIYHNNLGNLKKSAGDAAGAEESYRRAVRLDRKNADAVLNLGKLLESLGRMKEARECVVQSLRLAPRSVEGHMSLGRLEESAGKARAALESYGNAVRTDPKLAAGHLAVGNMHVKLEALEKAEASYRRALALDPEYADAAFNLANTLRSRERPEEAALLYRRAILLSGASDADVYNNYGLALSDLKRHTEAEKAFRRAIELRPEFDDAYFNLGKEMTTFGDAEAGIGMLRRAIAINPENGSAHLQLGVALYAKGMLREALEANRKALAFNRSCPVARRNLGQALAHSGDPDGLAILEELVRELPESPDLHWNWGEQLLRHGRYEEGWREYEWRMLVEDLRWQYRGSEVPRWMGEPGEPVAGKRILVYAEQGFGDTLQFARYARLLAELGATVILEVHSALRRWCAALPGVAECAAQGGELPEFDMAAPMMSLPYLLGRYSGMAAETIPPPVAPRFEAGTSGLGDEHSKLRVGIVWGGNSKHILDRLRSTRLTEWSGLAAVEGVEFTSLQMGGPAGQIDEGGHGFEFAATCKEARDFADTAAMVAGLDLVITVDTAVAHLAGSMGKPVWILLYNVVDWRWGLKGERTAWYPSARLFRQTTPGEWSGVFREVEAALREMVAGR
jgi:tetratricopeptide (TPR) repeat protein